MKLTIEKARKLHGRTIVHGMKVSIENARGTTRRWYDPHGKETGSTKMHHHYGYIRGTLGTDGDHVDVYVGPNPEATEAYVVTQMKKPDFDEIDEQKVMLGFDSAKEAREAYLKQYDDPRFFGSMKTMSIEAFKKKVFDKENHGEIIKGDSHKYTSRKPDGKGGWIYTYPKEHIIGAGAYSVVSARDEHTVTKRTKSKTDLHAFMKMRTDQALHGDRRGVLRVSKVDLKKDKNGAYPIIVERARTETDWTEGERKALAVALEFAIGTKHITESYVSAIQARLPGHGNGDAARIASFAEDLRQGSRAVVGDDHPDPKLDNIGLVKRDGHTMAVWLDFGSQDEVVKADTKLIHKALWATNGFTREEASKLAKLIDLDFAKHAFTLADFTEGLNVELEHRDVTQGKAVMTAKIALAHLKEKPDYYQRLRKVEKGTRILSLNDIAELRKADGSKPSGGGWGPIPGGTKNGMRRRKGDGWEYWYPSGETKAHGYSEEDYESGSFDKAPLKWHPKKDGNVDVHSKAPVKYAGSPMKLYQIVRADEAKGYVYARDLHANKHEKPVALRIDRLVAVEYDPNRRVGARVEKPVWTPGGSTKTSGFAEGGGEVSGTRAPKFADSKVDKDAQPGTWAIENGVYPVMSMTLFPTRRGDGKPEREKAMGVAVPDHGKQMIIAEYEPLITSAARGAKARYGLTGSEAETELRRAGLEGILAAMTTYRADVPFAAYAKGYVRNYVAVAASRERLGGVKLDARFERNLGRFFSAQHAATKAYGENPSEEQIAEHLNIQKKHLVPGAPADVRSQSIPMNDWKLSVKAESGRLQDTRTRPGKLSIVRAYRDFLAGEGSTAPLAEEVSAFPAMHMGLGLDPEQQIAVRQAVDSAARTLSDFSHGRYHTNMYEMLSRKFGLEGEVDDEPTLADLARDVPIYSVNADGKRKQVTGHQARVILAEMLPKALAQLSQRTEGRAKELIEQASDVIVPKPPPTGGQTYEERLRDRAAAVSDREVSEYREAERSRLERLREAATKRTEDARTEPERQQHAITVRATEDALKHVDRMPESEIRDRLARKLSPMTSEMRRAALATISAERNADTMVTDPDTGERRLVRMAKSEASSGKLSSKDALFMERYPQLAQLIYAPDSVAALSSHARRVVETLAGIRGDA